MRRYQRQVTAAAVCAWAIWAGAAAESATGAAAASAPALEHAKAEELFGKGRAALLRGDHANAVELLSQAATADPTKTSYRLCLARAYRHAGKSEEAAAELARILKESPDHCEAGQMLGEIHAAAGRWPDVVKVLEPLLAYRHDYPTYHLLAEAHTNAGNQDAARRCYEEAVKLNPESAPDHYQLGTIYLAGGFFARAVESYTTALRLGIDTPILRYKLGSAFFNLRNYFGQVRVRTVKSGAPGMLDGAWYLIEPSGRGGETFLCAPERSAVYHIAKALADGLGDRPDIHVLMATTHLNAGRYAQAYAMFSAIGPKVPKEDRALFLYYHAQAAFGTERYDEYLALLKEAIALNAEAYGSTLVDAYLKVADRYNQANDAAKYIEFLGKAIDATPENAALHLKLGNAYEEARAYDKAKVQWRMVLELEPDHPQRMRLLNLLVR
jgi:tetratricopeptide (TPR) repeat protein